MNFTAQIVIDRPWERVVELLRNQDHLAMWQPDWRYAPLLAGKLDQVGSQRRVSIQIQAIKIEMIETIVAFNPPNLISCVYTARGVRNLVENRFFTDASNSTRWVINNSIQFSGLMAFMGPVVGDYVVRQTTSAMQRFKQFAEEHD